MSPAGIHCLLELYECPASLLDNHDHIVSVLKSAADIAKSSLLREVSFQFNPQGVTALALLAESHISIHTWPERGYAAVDIFTCGDHTEPEKACRYIEHNMQAARSDLQVIKRGLSTSPLDADPTEGSISTLSPN